MRGRRFPGDVPGRIHDGAAVISTGPGSGEGDRLDQTGQRGRFPACLMSASQRRLTVGAPVGGPPISEKMSCQV